MKSHARNKPSLAWQILESITEFLTLLVLMAFVAIVLLVALF